MSIADDLHRVYDAQRLPSSYEGLICTFDLDKTYLATQFESLSGLVKIPFQNAEQKQNIPGAAAVVRELRRGAAKDQPPIPFYFISGSPRQLEGVIRDKLELDGVTYDGILFKDFKSALKKFQFKKIIDKIGFKLAALLYGRTVFPRRASELLFGDDSEYDATIYSLYADIVAGRLTDFEVLTILKKWQVARDERDVIAENLERLKEVNLKHESVSRIFIHLEMGSSPQDHNIFSELVTPTHNYFQTALMLYNMGTITRAGLFRIISELIRTYHFSVREFAVSIEDLLRRSLIEKKEARKLLKIVSKGNPLAQTRGWMLEFTTEFGRVLEQVTRMPETIRQPRRRKEDLNMSLVERYLRYTPSRKV